MVFRRKISDCQAEEEIPLHDRASIFVHLADVRIKAKKLDAAKKARESTTRTPREHHTNTTGDINGTET